MLAPFVNLFIRLGISPDVVTLVGTTGVSFGALWFFPRGMVWEGVLFITAFVFSDLNLPILLEISLWALAIAATVTVAQRIWVVRRQALARAASAA